MPKLSADFKENVKHLSADNLYSIVINYAKKSKDFYDYINLNYLNDENAKREFFEETKKKALIALMSSSRGNLYRQIASSVGKAIKHVNYYKELTKDKKGEADLLNIILKEVFDDYSQHLGTCFTVFDSKLASTVNRLINLVNKKLHEDYKIDYEDDINRYLGILHEKSNHLDFVYSMPEKI